MGYLDKPMEGLKPQFPEFSLSVTLSSGYYYFTARDSGIQTKHCVVKFTARTKIVGHKIKLSEPTRWGKKAVLVHNFRLLCQSS